MQAKKLIEKMIAKEKSPKYAEALYFFAEICRGFIFSRISCPISISNEFNYTLQSVDLSVNSVLKVKFESNDGLFVFYSGKILEIFVRQGTTQIKVWFEDDETQRHILTELLGEEYFCNDSRKSVKAMPLLMLSTLLRRTTNYPKK